MLIVGDTSLLDSSIHTSRL